MLTPVEKYYLEQMDKDSLLVWVFDNIERTHIDAVDRMKRIEGSKIKGLPKIVDNQVDMGLSPSHLQAATMAFTLDKTTTCSQKQED